jgi:hypothetical protein
MTSEARNEGAMSEETTAWILVMTVLITIIVCVTVYECKKLDSPPPITSHK